LAEYIEPHSRKHRERWGDAGPQLFDQFGRHWDGWRFTSSTHPGAPPPKKACKPPKDAALLQWKRFVDRTPS
jgi:hypothetical protein